MLDLLIRNALVFDGTGAEPVVKDVAIQHGKIRATGHCLSESATQVVDADGLALMPGIIDSHSHFDAQITPSAFIACGSTALGSPTVEVYCEKLRLRDNCSPNLHEWLDTPWPHFRDHDNLR